MINSSTCMVCAKPFPYRKSKQYCSNSCKQQAYNNKKAGETISGIPGPVHQVKNRIFYFEDFLNYKKTYSWREDIDLVTYFFIIKNFIEDESISFINEAADNILSNELEANLKKENNPVGRQFAQFQNEFHLGNYLVKEKRITDPLPEEQTQVHRAVG